MICVSYTNYQSGQLSWRPLQEVSFQISKNEFRPSPSSWAIMCASCLRPFIQRFVRAVLLLRSPRQVVNQTVADSPVFLASCSWGPPSWATLEGSVFSRRCCYWSCDFVFPTGATTLYEGVRCGEYFHRFHELFSLFRSPFVCLKWSSHQKYTEVVLATRK